MLEQLLDERLARKKARWALFGSISALVLIICADLLYFYPYYLLPLDKVAQIYRYQLLSWVILAFGLGLIIYSSTNIFLIRKAGGRAMRPAIFITLLAAFVIIIEVLARFDIISLYQVTYS